MRALVSSFVCACWPFACTAPPPAVEAPPPDPGSSSSEPQSAEWLYATDGVPGGRKAECRALATGLESEARCTGALCSHGASLGEDWLRVCKKLTPELSGDVERRVEDLRKKARTAPVACEQEVERLLKSGCGKREDCAGDAQSWATRCADFSTPLVLRMLEIAIERGGGERSQLDARACPALLADVQKAGACTQQFACQDGFAAIDTYRARCVSPARPISLTAAVLELAVRSGASPSVEPLAFASGSKLDPALVPLIFEDGSGAVLMTCGKRAASVDAYLELRKPCTDGELVLARSFDGPEGPRLRVGRLPHLGDVAFLAAFPTLRVEGEPKARYRAALPAFLSSVDLAAKTAADPRQSADALRILIAAIESNIDAVRNSADLETALREKDDALTPLFAALGEAKKKALHADLASTKLVPAMLRGSSFQLADVDVEGRVRLGAVTQAASVEMGDFLPKSVAAYQAALAGRWKLVEKKKLGTRDTEKLGLAADGEASRCGQAMKGVDASEKILIACAFGLETCDEAKVVGAVQKAGESRRAAESSWPRSVLALASLPREQRAGAEKAAELAGCREPWW